MDPDLLKLLNLAFFFFLALVILVIVLQIRKRLVLKRKLNEYTKLLEQAIDTRRAFHNTMEKAKFLLAKVDATKNELSDSKARLDEFRGELREKLQKIRQEIAKEDKTGIDNRHIGQMKIKFEQHWKLFNSLKQSYCENQSLYPSLQEQYDVLAKEEQHAYQQWTQDKELVFRSYNEITKLTHIQHPNEILGKDKPIRKL